MNIEQTSRRSGKVKSRWLRRFSTCFFTMVLIVFTVSQAKAQKEPMLWLHVKGNHLENSFGHYTVLRGAATPDLQTLAGRPGGINGVIDKMIDGGIGIDSGVIRLAVFPWLFAQNPDMYFKSYLKPAAEHCVQKRIYCIVDYHGFGDRSYNYNSPVVDRQIRSFWSYVAPKFKDVPNIFFELFNEPVNPQDWSTWKQTAQPWVDLIRAVAPKIIIIIGSPLWSSFTRFAATDPFRGSNLVYTLHLYPETFQGGGLGNWDRGFGRAAQTLPIFITELGWPSTDPQASKFLHQTTSDFGVPVRRYLDNVHPNVNWIAWVYDPSWQPTMVDWNYNPLVGEEHEGKFIQQWLQDKRNSSTSQTNHRPVTR